jgi:parvulin-like peptidyl-prolyl isomerase
VSAQRHGAEAGTVAEGLLARLKAGEAPLELGDSTILPRDFQQQTVRDLDAQLGPAFTERLGELPVGEWAGPVPSSYGVHLVRVSERIPGTLPPLAKVREAVERDLLHQRREQARAAFYKELRGRYTVTIERPADDGASGAPVEVEDGEGSGE